METVNNMAAAAAKAVWGENKTTDAREPLSGEQGNTAAGEPFDKGNLDSDQAVLNMPTTKPSTDTNTSSTRTDPTTSTHNTSSLDPTTTNPISPVTSEMTHRPKDTTSDTTDTASAATFAKESGRAAESDKVPDNPSTDFKAKSDVPVDSTKGQNDVRDPEDPQTNPKNAPTDVDNTGDGPNEAQKLEGAGPKPLETIAKEKGGDAGQSGGAGGADKGVGEKDESGPGAPSTGEGTGEEYVKSSGLKADGGDFDATKPGAGREADRLLEKKGIHKEKPDTKPDEGADSAASGSHDAVDEAGKKKSTLAKIKEKLHHKKGE
ncbi:uncharacterized protein BCR38DRAFT_90380 [Pseudomassariella vexata]|uniref:Glycine-rich cell wall structural protein 1 n=1 Tax=Pseudomassariella vexata TaxID=1141098 RepID=A0A1Y2EE63_9PEZI|nr:uncharacterized protein BCR38DRAFT_90380 [Pseudomassariella vexata]ORY69687.1 hypothetical protein BCR38DRAFT_90380 [Pseudomassariella vexata]